MAFSSKRYSREIRLEAALFIGAMCRTSLLTVRACGRGHELAQFAQTQRRSQLQMFVSCQGLRSLVEMLDENCTCTLSPARDGG